MGDSVWTIITIGGAMKRCHLPRMREIIENWQGEDNSGFDQDLMPIEGEAITFAGCYNNGCLHDDVKAELQAMGLMWREHCDALGGQWSGMIRQWTPVNGLEGCTADEEGPTISLPELERAQNEGRSLADILAMLQHFSEPLPPISIVEG